MIILDTNNKSLEFLLSGSVTTNQLPFVTSYVDISQSDFSMSGAPSSNGVSNNTTAVTLVTAPAASTSRQVKYVSIQNADTASATVTVRFNDNATTRNILIITLDVNDSLIYIDGKGWFTTNDKGAIKTTTGILPGDNVSFSDIHGTGSFRLSNIVSPAQITANQNNYAPTGIATAYEIRVDSDAARDITGIDATWSDGRELVITNDGSFPITLKHEDTNSTAGNRFDLSENADVILNSGASIKLRYDGTVSRIRVIGGTGGAGGEKDDGNNVIGFANKQATAGNYTLAADENMVTTGPFTITSGHTITITSGARWVII